MLFHKIDKIITNLSQKLFFTISTIIQFAFAFVDLGQYFGHIFMKIF